jgi:hypothetical protein
MDIVTARLELRAEAENPSLDPAGVGEEERVDVEDAQGGAQRRSESGDKRGIGPLEAPRGEPWRRKDYYYGMLMNIS